MTYETFVFDRPIGRARRSVSNDEIIRGGSLRGLAFSIEWTASALAGTLSFALANEQVWSTAGTALPADLWLKFLAGLSRAWLHILLEEGYPRGLSVERPSQIESALVAQVFNIDDAVREADAFGTRHDISAWISPDRSLPSLWMIREGNFMVLESGGRVSRWAYSDVVRTLRELGDHIADRARAILGDKLAVRAWESREEVNDATLEEISLGVRSSRLDAWPLPVRSRSEMFRGMDEVRVAARMLAHRVPDAELGAIIERISLEPHRDAPQMRQWSQRAAGELASLQEKLPRLQGRDIARWLRGTLSNPKGRVEPQQVLAEWGVTVTSFQTVREIEAIAFWGPTHGPAILCNQRSKRSSGGSGAYGLPGGVRFTLAHELAHLLLDVEGSFPVGEVLGGSLPRLPEERANAFAAEFLLPEDAAGEIYQQASDREEALRKLTTRFGVTKTLAAWQILKRFGENSPVLAVADFAALKQMVRQKNWRGPVKIEAGYA